MREEITNERERATIEKNVRWMMIERNAEEAVKKSIEEAEAKDATRLMKTNTKETTTKVHAMKIGGKDMLSSIQIMKVKMKRNINQQVKKTGTKV